MANKRKTKKSYNKKGGASSVQGFPSFFDEEGKINMTPTQEEKKSSSKAKIGLGAIVIVGGVVVLGLALAKKL